MLETSARLLRLLALLQTRASWTGPELVDRLEVTSRTLRRDMDRLRDLGYPVDSEPGRAGGYRLGAGASMPPLLLDDEEALAIAIGLATTTFAGSKALARAWARAQAKVEQGMPARVRRRFDAVRRAIARAPERESAALTPVAPLVEAVSERRAAAFGYRDHHGASTARTVEPHRLVLAEGRWYLVAWDVERADWRSFRVDRIDDVRLVGSFTPRAGPASDAAAFVAEGVERARFRVHAEVLLHAPADAMRARLGAWGSVEPAGKRRARWKVRGGSLDAMLAWIASLDVPFTIVAPPELARRAHVLSERLRASGAQGSLGSTVSKPATARNDSSAASEKARARSWKPASTALRSQSRARST